MAGIDLIPGDYARKRELEVRVRRFLVALALVLGLVALGRAGIEILISLQGAEVARLRARGELSAQEAAKADAYRKQKRAVEKQLAELDELRGRDRLMLLLRAIDNAYIDRIWFDEMHFFRRENLTAGRLDAVPGGSRAGIIVVPKENIPPPGTTIKPLEIEQHAEIVGHALSHTSLAEFMRGLGRQPGVADVRLLDTGSRSYANAVVVDLKLSLLIDEKARGAK